MQVQVTTRKSENQSFRSRVGDARDAAEAGAAACHAFLDNPANRPTVECALRIRAVEMALYELFGKGKLHGTIHTCVGQEFSGAMLRKHMREDDFVSSNHRCHGHFIGATDDWRGLIDEIIGNQDGVCAGIGSSQHLWAPNFLSNGQQGGLLPVAAGLALDRKQRGTDGVVFSFIGEGTLGEGIVYETLNLDSLWQLPHVIICENNFYSQSTPQGSSVAGDIAMRPLGFNVESAVADTWDLPAFDSVLKESIDRARKTSAPVFLTLTTYRLNPHSKGDDHRDRAEVEWFARHDPASLAVQNHRSYRETYERFVAEAAEHIALGLAKPGLAPAAYFPDQLPRQKPGTAWRTLGVPADDQPRIAQQLNEFYREWMEHDAQAIFLGEDIADPYGGAFKIAKGFTTRFGPRALTTPISEAAITGVGIGLALAGRRAFVEIMFGDFITYAFDQIINNASKMFHAYDRKLSCPVVIRTPMGGRRGYGPTHSQSLERFLIGIDNCGCVSLNSLAPASLLLAGLQTLQCPVILLENKSDYAAKTFAPPAGYVVECDDAVLPTLRLRPARTRPGVTIVSYGGMARFVANAIIEMFERTDAVPELIVPTGLSPLDVAPIAESVRQTGRLVIVEEGAGFGSVGAELAAQLQELGGIAFAMTRVSGRAAPVASAPGLETACLPSIDDVCAAILRTAGEGAAA